MFGFKSFIITILVTYALLNAIYITVFFVHKPKSSTLLKKNKKQLKKPKNQISFIVNSSCSVSELLPPQKLLSC